LSEFEKNLLNNSENTNLRKKYKKFYFNWKLNI
jgi:hypothetical protein